MKIHPKCVVYFPEKGCLRKKGKHHTEFVACLNDATVFNGSGQAENSASYWCAEFNLKGYEIIPVVLTKYNPD